MKHFGILIPALAGLFLFSCGKNPDPVPEPTVIDVMSVSLDKTELTLFPGSVETLVATVKPDNASDKTVVWSSSDTGVATVDDGMVTTIKSGTATITAKAGEKSAACQVTVVAGECELTLSSTDATILKAAGGSSTAILSTSANWSLSSDSSWLTVSQTSGSAGKTELLLSTTANGSGESRTAHISILMGGATKTVSVKQRPDVLTRTKSFSGRVTNGVKLTYSGSNFTRIYMVLPRPVTNQYQDISNWEAPGCNEVQCLDGVNTFIWKDVQAGDIPASGDFVMSEDFDATVYHVTTDFSKMDDIPEYDLESEECKKYLGKEEGGLIDPTNSKIVSRANTLWALSDGIIDYARKCFGWTSSNMTYGNMNTGLHTISSLMQTMTGDCGNYSSVFISLLRAKGIPARHVVMVHGKKDEFHVRAEFYVPAYGWIPADPTWGDGYFGVFEGAYIVMTQGINTIIRDWTGADIRADLLQTTYYWYWGQTNSFSFTHSCLGLH